MKGIYHQADSALPSEILGKLSMVRPRSGEGIGYRELALVAIAIGGSLLALVGPALILFGAEGPNRRPFPFQR